MNHLTDPEKAYMEPEGPVLLVAGPGTGKTYQLGRRVEFLINEMKVDHAQISVITFTTDAAKNMRNRLLDKELNLDPQKVPHISTIHSLGNTIIGKYFKELDLPKDYQVLTNTELKKILLQDASHLCNKERSDYLQTSDCRLKGICHQDSAQVKCQICIAYQDILRKCLLIDFDDQIFLACDLLKSNSSILAEYQNQTKYLLVDEFQDINFGQFEMIQMLSSENQSGLFVVGDDDQSIYSFRGGSPNFIYDFDKHFGDNSKIGILSKSWRCSEKILLGAKSMLSAYYTSPVTKPESSFSDSIALDNKVVFLDVPSDEKEAYGISKLILKKIENNKIILIIPNKNYFPKLKDKFNQQKIPYKYKSVFREKGLDRLSVLTEWISNTKDNSSLRYLLELIIENHDELIQSQIEDGSGIVQKRIAASNIVADLWQHVDNKRNSLESVIINKSGESDFLENIKNILTEIWTIYTKEGGKRKYLSVFLEKCGLYLSPGGSPKGFIQEIDDWKSEIKGGSIDSSFDPVLIYNLPSSKGLEADVIFVIGISDKLYPNEMGDIEEQARLFYVAMTRAKKELFLFSARSRSTKITFKPQSFQLSPSRFISSISDEYIDKQYIRS